MMFSLSKACLTVASPGLKNWWSRRINQTIYPQDTATHLQDLGMPLATKTDYE